jgi:fatty-acyl-CoA synthase
MTLSALLSRQADRHPQKTALMFENRRISYRELDARAAATAELLRAGGVGKGMSVAHLAFNDISFFEVLFACSRLGAIMVPVNFRLTADEIRFQLANSAAHALIYSGDFEQTAEDLKAGSSGVRLWQRTGDAGLCPDAEAPAQTGVQGGHARHAPDDCLMMIHTSGTTGRPKAAMLSERNILGTSLNQISDFSLSVHDTTLTVAPLFHAGGSLIFSVPLLILGGTVILHRHFDPATAVSALGHDGVTCMFAAPAMWQHIISLLEGTDRRSPHLRICVSGGAAETEKSMIRFREIFGVPLMQGYGLSECSSTSTILRAEHAADRLGSVGKPALTNRLRIVMPDGRDAAPGEVGEIIQNDDTVMMGYYNDEAATRETIRDGWLHTGDLATTDAQGFIYIKGRKKEMIISGGENIYPAEVEAVLNAHPDIVESAVVGADHAEWGETPVAFVVATRGANPDADAIIGYCKKNIASYKKPSRVIFVDELPRNPSGKVKKFELRDRLKTGPDRD